jgi:hypothetical protein
MSVSSTSTGINHKSRTVLYVRGSKLHHFGCPKWPKGGQIWQNIFTIKSVPIFSYYSIKVQRSIWKWAPMTPGGGPTIFFWKKCAKQYFRKCQWKWWWLKCTHCYADKTLRVVNCPPPRGRARVNHWNCYFIMSYSGLTYMRQRQTHRLKVKNETNAEMRTIFVKMSSPWDSKQCLYETFFVNINLFLLLKKSCLLVPKLYKGGSVKLAKKSQDI